jgi:hypothetical protein
MSNILLPMILDLDSLNGGRTSRCQRKAGRDARLP